MGLRYTLAGWFFKLSRWNLVVEEEPPKGPAVLIGAPHTSNWDFILMLAIAGRTGMKFRWLGKSSLFKWPLGGMLRKMGGIPVDRSSSHGLVDRMVAMLDTEEDQILAITPKGTRGRREYWKSGFYRIATAAQVPVVLCFVDGSSNTTGLGPTMFLSGDAHEDMDVIRAFYAGKTGVRPQLTSVPRLRDEDEGQTPEQS